MFDITENNMILLGSALAGLFIGLQLLLSLFMFTSLRIASKERAQINKEMFGLVKRIEGLTSHKREMVLKHYDGILESLSRSLPPAVAAHASQIIFETESKILSRLAELEPALKNDEVSRRKMDELIKTMENLEKTIVALASDTVHRVMSESRRTLLDDSTYSDTSMAA